MASARKGAFNPDLEGDLEDMEGSGSEGNMASSQEMRKNMRIKGWVS